MEVKIFDADAAATTGFGTERNSGEKAIRLPYGIRILAVKQPTGVAAANDATWKLWAGYKDTGQIFDKSSLLPTNDGGIKLGPTGITIGPNVPIQMSWVQAVAQANAVELYFERA